MDADASFERLLRAAESDPEVVGVVLGGSRGKGALVTDRSDYDVYVVVRGEAARLRWAERHAHARGDPLEVVVATLDQFRRHALPGSETAWNAYTFAHVTPALDRGGIADLIAEKTSVEPASAAEPLDAYVNSYYRSAKNARDRLAFEARLDAAESIAHFLEFLFAAFGRVRPYNKWLRWELAEHPLPPSWTADDLPARLERVLEADVAAQQALFRDAEHVARARGLDPVIDAWEPDVAWLRGM